MIVANASQTECRENIEGFGYGQNCYYATKKAEQPQPFIALNDDCFILQQVFLEQVLPVLLQWL